MADRGMNMVQTDLFDTGVGRVRLAEILEREVALPPQCVS